MRLDAYSKALKRFRFEPARDLDAPASDGLKFSMPATFRESVQIGLTDALRPWARLRARAFANPLRLHLGCGGTHLQGWVNVDLIGLPAIDLAWNLRHQLPFPDGSADAIFHEHLLEHMPLAAALTLLGECHRLLGSQGIIRVGVPDSGRYIRDLVQPAGVIDLLRPGRPTPLMALAEVAYCYGHRWLWDGPSLCIALRETGFVDVAICPFGQSTIAPAPDSISRGPETVYVEGVHP